MTRTRLRLLSERKVKVVLDVGANCGQWATQLRGDGYHGTIVSFEPLQSAYQQLQEASRADPAWQVMRTAAGDDAGMRTIHVSANSYSSSLLHATNRSVDAIPETASIRSEPVPVAILDRLDLPPGPAMLKIDVQGAELSVLRGARSLLERVELVEIELSLVELYEGQALAPAVCSLLREAGFIPVALDVPFVHPTTGEILQLDGLFARPATREPRAVAVVPRPS
jgi:FkbM family methyltransferase